MLIFPAIDLYDGKAVRLYKGDYANMTIYSHDPLSVAKDFEAAGATWIHMVDLEGAKAGTTPNLHVVASVAQNTQLKVEIGGGIRSMDTIKAYLDAGVSRVILGTAAVTDPVFLQEALATYGDKIAVGVDIKDGKVAIKGWLETADDDAMTFCQKMQDLGVSTIICTDISRDGAMQGSNNSLYALMSQKFSLQIIASGGVSSMDDIQKLTQMKLYGAIVGNAYYTGAISLKQAIEVSK